MKIKLLVIGHTFPEPSTTAAGSRMMQLLSLFLENGCHITFGSTANISERSSDLKALGITSEILKLNDPSFDTFIAKLQPDIVIFDRFVTEEQFGWRVTAKCPDALKILDTEDLHFLRKARETAFKKEGNLDAVNLYTDTAKRELASILRCDLSLIISEIEITLLVDTFKIPEGILQYVPFLPKAPLKTKVTFPKFSERKDFVVIGNLFHAPNVDSVKWLHKEIWPAIRKQLPSASLHVYGAYAPQQITELHNEQTGFLIKGWAPSIEEVMSKARVCLAPLRFGAGLKGKLLDAMIYGTPAITTTIGAEGMYGLDMNAGGIADEVTSFANCAVNCYSEKRDWLHATNNAASILENRYNSEVHSKNLLVKIQHISVDLNCHRSKHFMGQILQQQGMQASKYMSKWISLKNEK